MPFTAASLSTVAKLLPVAALEIFQKAANEAEGAGLAFNDCIRQGWAATKEAGWQAPVTGKRWILTKDSPDGGDVHVPTTMGSKKKPKKGDDSGDEFEAGCAKVCKVDESLGLVFGFAIVCKEDGQEYFDVQGDHIPEDAMLKSACDFMQNSRVAKEMHEGGQVGTIVFAWPMTSDIAKAMGIETPTTGLMIAMKPPADILGKYKSGEYTGFSIGGRRGEDEEVD